MSSIAKPLSYLGIGILVSTVFYGNMSVNKSILVNEGFYYGQCMEIGVNRGFNIIANK